MRYFPKRTLISIGIVLALAGILAMLAVLQYRWSGEVSQAERERMQASLRAATTQFRQEFARDLQLLGQSFQPDAMILMNEDWQRFARGLIDSQIVTDHPLASGIYLWVAESGAGPRLLKLELRARSFEPTSWPAELEPVRIRYERTFSNMTRLPAEIRPNSWMLIPDASLMTHPLVLFQPMAGLPSANTRFLGYLLIGLNLKLLQTELLPELAQRYFGGPDGFVYHVAIISGPGLGKIIYQSDAGLDPTAFASPDARIPLLDDLRPRMGRRGSGPGGDMRPPGPEDPRMPFLPPGRGRGRGAPMLLTVGDGADWELRVIHREGSLEAVVSGMRRRNLAIGFGILLLLACSVGLIVAYAQRAQRLAQLQMDFVAGVSHELRTPLAVICSAGDNLAEGVVAASGKQVQEYGELIRGEGWKLTGMVEQILQFATLRKGKRQYSLSPGALDEIVEKTLQKASPLIQAAGFEVEKSIEPDLPLVNVDAQALAQCMLNLINNALKYSGESRWLAVRVLKSQDKKRPEVQLVIEDRGMGIAPADLPHIFDPFYRGEAATAAQIHGTGLGLCMTRETITAMAGSVTVKSAPGKGSAFTIHLPVFTPEETRPLTPAGPPQE